jgi:hypothetical protein
VKFAVAEILVQQIDEFLPEPWWQADPRQLELSGE